MKKIFITVIVIILAYAGYHYLIKKDTPEEPIVEQTNVMQEKPEWVSLFDGKTFNGWHLYNGDSIPDSWAIIDGAMVYTPIENEPLESIVTDKPIKIIPILCFPLNGRYLKEEIVVSFGEFMKIKNLMNPITPDRKYKSLIMINILMVNMKLIAPVHYMI
jgi:hypothetical protein